MRKISFYPFHIFFFLIVICKSLIAQEQESYDEIDLWARQIHLNDTGIAKLTNQLTAPATTEKQKIRAIFQFVVNHLEYDFERAKPESRTYQNIYDILQRKKGICWDYAQLISHMSGKAGIICFTVSGFSKDEVTQRIVSNQPDHAWNVVYADGDYYLLDATWQSNLKNLQNQTLARNYFFSDPGEFIKDHFPELPFFQLLSCPWTFNEFLEAKQKVNIDSCQLAFRDSIDLFKTLSFEDRKIREAASVVSFRPDAKNFSTYGHALLDKAMVMKDKGDLLFENSYLNEAGTLYLETIHLFQKAQPYTTLYDWQKEAWAFCHLNYGQLFYRQNYQDGKPALKTTKEHLTLARDMLLQMEKPNILTKQALEQIKNQLAILD